MFDKVSYMKKWRRKNRDKVSAYQKIYCHKNKKRIAEMSKKYQKEHRKELNLKKRIYNQEHPEYARINYHRHKKRIGLQHKKYKLLNPQVPISHNIVNALIRSGKLKRLPCEICGKERTDGHHRDYNKPREVVWLCRPHHNEEHRKMAAL